MKPLRGGVEGVVEGRSPSTEKHFPLSFEGEGDTGGEVGKANLFLWDR